MIYHDILQYIIIDALVYAIMGVCWVQILVSPDGILSFLPVKLKPILPVKLSYVLFECEKCNATWWAIFGYMAAANIKAPAFIQYGITLLFFTMFIAYIITLLINKIKYS